MQKALFVINPVSNNGSTGSRWKKIETKVLSYFPQAEVQFTQRSNHAEEIVRQALKEKDFHKIIVVGGDGTLSEAARGFFENHKPIKTKAALGILPAGTGSDFAKTVNMPVATSGHEEEAAKVLSELTPTPIDVGKVTYLSNQNLQETRIFINIADIGIGGEVVKDVNESFLGGPIAYKIFTVVRLIQYENKKMMIHVDGKPIEGKFNLLVVANGKYFGGGMKIAPNAQIDDGLFDVLIFPEMSKLEMIMQMDSLKDGSHIHRKEILQYRAKKVSVESFSEALLDIDGDQPGKAPAEFEIIPKAISFLTRKR